MLSLPSNLRDTTELEQMTHEVRLSSTDAGPLQWQAGVFYSNIKRNYSQRLPTPGWDDDYMETQGSPNSGHWKIPETALTPWIRPMSSDSDL